MGRKAAQRGKAPEGKGREPPAQREPSDRQTSPTADKPPTFSFILCGLRLCRAWHARREQVPSDPLTGALTSAHLRSSRRRRSFANAKKGKKPSENRGNQRAAPLSLLIVANKVLSLSPVMG